MSEIKASIPKDDCTATSCPVCGQPCEAGSTNSGFITNSGACLKCVFHYSADQIRELLAARSKDSEPSLVTDCMFNNDTPKAVQILNEAVQIMAERGKSYDKSGGQAERSMPKIVAMFNALTGHELTPAQGWKFMACLKLARSEQGEHREDNYLDGAAYFALAGEEDGEDSK